MRLFLIFFLIVSFQVSFSQNIGKVTVIDSSIDPAGIVDELPLAPALTIGSTYLYDEWLPCDLDLINNQKVMGYLMKYDLKNKVLEIDNNGIIKICPFEKIKAFTLRGYNPDEPIGFVNSTYLIESKSNNPRKILSRVYEGEKLTLYKHYYLDIKEATYVPALDMGTKNNKIVIKHEYYLLLYNSFNKFHSSLKKNKIIFGKQYSKIEDFAKENRLKLKRQKDIILLMEFYQTLL